MRNAIALVADAHLFPPALFLASRLARLNPRQDTDILLFTDAGAGVMKARALIRGFGIYQVLDFAEETGPAPLRSGISEAAYFRISLPRLLGGEYRRMIYLDIDTYPVDDAIFSLFDLPLNASGLAAVRDLNIQFTSLETRKPYFSALGVLGKPYLNSGVLVIDIPTYIRTRVEVGCRQLALTRPDVLLCQDQSALNAAMAGAWTELSPRFNSFFLYDRTIVTAAFPPSLVHFAGNIKHWHTPSAGMTHPARRELEAFLDGTPFARFFQDPALVAMRAALPSKPPPKLGPGGLIPIEECDLPEPLVRAYLTETVFADVEAGLTPRPALVAGAA